MFKEKDTLIRQFLIALDIIVISVAFFLAFLLRSKFETLYTLNFIPSSRVISDFAVPLSDYLIVLFLVAPLYSFMLFINGMYKSMRVISFLEISWMIIKSVFFVIFAFAAFAYLLKLDFVSRVFFTLFIIISSVAILLEKAVIFNIMHYVRRQGRNYRRLLIVGTGRRANDFVDKLKCHPEWGFQIIGAVDFEQERVGKDFGEVKVIGTIYDIPHILHTRTVDEIIFVVPRSRLSEIQNYIYVCEIEGIKTTVAADFFDLKISHLRQEELDGVPLITFETTPARVWELFIKRTVDIIVSGLAIIVLFIPLLVIAILIKVTSTGPIFYLQKRVGLNGRRFILFKFRSMRKGAHRELSKLSAQNEMQGPVFKIKDDPRITPIGKFLRKSSIDELPQLMNVFVGHMSLVGPRPPIYREVRKYETWQRRRLSMRPGLTCIWQISGRNKIDFDNWMKLDLEYIDSWSLWLDFRILVKTIPVVLFGRGAY
ncbi:MAG: sugar transferase [Candidatus Omnitrophica bacterium]|nr:sugar transferase [Candidatus Omnitrophota bacterium]